MRRRLARIDETRERITAAAYELHGTVGPSRTTISAIAERAGVERHTVYQHFPDVESLWEACTAHGLRVTAIPQPENWVAIVDPEARLVRGLSELYRYYRANERMLATILGDAAATEPPAEPDLFERHMANILATLTAGWRRRAGSRRIVGAVIAHAISFETWHSLTTAGLSDDQARDLLANVVAGVAEGALTATSAPRRTVARARPPGHQPI